MNAEVNDLFEEQARRFLACGHCPDDLRNVKQILEEKCLTPEAIQLSTAEELKRVLVLRYDVQMNTNRLEGYGWNSSKIREHMTRFLKSKLQDMARIFNGYQCVEMHVES